MTKRHQYEKAIRSVSYAKTVDKKARFKRDTQLYKKNHVFIEADKVMNTNIL